MKNFVAILIVFLSLVSGRLALAQSPGDSANPFGDILNRMLSGRPGNENRSWHGHLVQARDTTMIFRAEDGKVYAVDMSAIDTPTWHPIVLGQALTLAARPGPEPQTLIAARIEPEQPDRAGQLRAKREFRTVHGTVDRVEGSRVMVRSQDGTVLAVDVARMTGEAQFRARDGAVVFLEPGPGNTVMWIEREDRRESDRGDRRDSGDILSGLPGEYQRLHGARVHASGATMILRADDGRTYVVDMSAVNTRVWNPIELGQAVTLAAKPGREPNTLIAERLQADPADRSAKKPFASAQGTVESVQGSEFRFRTTDGSYLWADASHMPGRAPARVNDQGTLTYEPGPRRQVTALWLEPQETQPAASSSAVDPGAYQRIHGYVQSVGSSTMSFKADDGRTLTVDTSQVDAQVRGTVRQGDLVSVVGKMPARPGHFVAEVIERETRR